MRRMAGLFFLCLLIASASAYERPSEASAQDAAPKAEDAAPKAVVGDNQPARSSTASESGTSYIGWWLRSSGVIGLFILGLSIYFVATVVRLFVEMRSDVASPPELVQRLEDLLRDRDFPAVYGTANESDSFLGRTLATGLAELPGGLSEARNAMERMGDAETIEMEKKTSMLAVLGTLGPMIGLIGTLQGMISSFSVIAQRCSTQALRSCRWHFPGARADL